MLQNKKVKLINKQTYVCTLSIRICHNYFVLELNNFMWHQKTILKQLLRIYSI